MNTIKTFIDKVINYDDLTEEEATRAFQIMLKGGATPVQISALLTGLRMKGESVVEITSAAKVMRAKAIKFKSPNGAIDTCGTGGDNSGTFNISTAVAFVVAGCQVPVAKHGNKAISSKSGSADVLTELGVNINAEKHIMEKALKQANICFMMAPNFHKDMRHVGPTRSELGIRTIFNVLGPLSNPASAEFQLLGVYSKRLVKPVAHVLNKLGVKRAWVVHGSDGLDELTTTGPSIVAKLNNNKVSISQIHPKDAGLKKVKLEELQGGDVNRNAQEMKALLTNRGNTAYKDIVLLNAAASLVVAGKARTLLQGKKLAEESLGSGKANEALLNLANISNGG